MSTPSFCFLRAVARSLARSQVVLGCGQLVAHVSEGLVAELRHLSCAQGAGGPGPGAQKAAGHFLGQFGWRGQREISRGHQPL